MNVLRCRLLSTDGRVGLLILIGGAVLTGAVELLPNVARAVVALPIAMALPGYAIRAVLLGTVRHDEVVTLSVSVIISIVFYVLTALMLYAVGIRITTTSEIVSVDVAVVVAAMSLLFRRSTRRAVEWRRVRVMIGAAGAAALVVAAAVVGARAFAPPPTTASGFSSIAFTGAWAQAQLPPRLLTRRLSFAVQLSNRTGGFGHYRLVAWLDGKPWATRTADVATGHSSTVSFDGQAPSGPCSRRLSVGLLDGSSARQLTNVTMQLASASPPCSGKRGAT